jgi:hypothetical protein
MEPKEEGKERTIRRKKEESKRSRLFLLLVHAMAGSRSRPFLIGK